MTDDTLTLELAPAPDIAPIPNGVTMYPADDGEGVVRMRVVTSDGVTHDLTPAPVAAPAQRLTSPGFHGPAIPRQLVSAEHRLGCMGAVDHDVPAGALLSVSWRQIQGGQVGWGEVAVYASNGLGPKRLVASANAAQELTYLGTVTKEVPTTGWIQRGEMLWFTLAIWLPPAWTHPVPQVLCSAYPDPIASGGVARIIGAVAESRPSEIAALGQAIGVDPQAGTLPIVAVVLVP